MTTWHPSLKKTKKDEENAMFKKSRIRCRQSLPHTAKTNNYYAGQHCFLRMYKSPRGLSNIIGALITFFLSFSLISYEPSCRRLDTILQRIDLKPTLTFRTNFDHRHSLQRKRKRLAKKYRIKHRWWAVVKEASILAFHHQTLHNTVICMRKP